MVIFATNIPVDVLSNYFNIEKCYRIIDVNQILEDVGNKINTVVYKFLVNQEIKNRIMKYSVYSLYNKGIIYINSNLNDEIIQNLKKLDFIEKVILIDNFYCPSMKKLWNIADEVISLPEIKSK